MTDTIGNQRFVPYSKVSLTNAGSSGIFPVGVVCMAVEHNMAAFLRAFLCCMLAGNAK